MVKGGADFFFISLPFFFLSFFLILSSQKFEGGLKGGSMVFWGLGGAGAPLDPVLPPPLVPDIMFPDKLLENRSRGEDCTPFIHF